MGWLYGPSKVSTNQAPQSAFEAKEAQTEKTDYSGAIGGGLSQSDAARKQQAALADALMAQARGQGPSLAQAQLKQATDRQLRQAASAVNSQRGINPALAARLIEQNRATIGQEAAGQSASLRAQEQLNAQGMLANVLQSARGQDISQFGTAGGLQQQQSALGVQNWQQTQALNQATSSANVQAKLEQARINAGIEQANKAAEDSFNQRVLGGALGAAGVIGGTIAGGPAGGAAGYTAGNAAGSAIAGGGEEESITRPEPMSRGGKVRGKAKSKGDSRANDTVPAMLSPGEIVLPRSVAQAPDADEKAAAFVRALKREKEGGEASGFGRVLAKLRELQAEIEELSPGGLATARGGGR